MGKFRKVNPRMQAIAIAVAIAFALWVGYLLYAPLERGNDEAVKFVVAHGDGLSVIAQGLKDAGLIRSRFLFRLYVSAADQDDNLKAGTYTFSRALSSVKIAEIIAGGFADSNDYQILLAEGFNIWEIDRRLAEYGMSEQNAFAEKYIEYEGYLFPDTYRIARPASGQFDLNLIGDEVFRKMREEFDRTTSVSLEGLSDARKKQVIIVASMIEKEARLERDMKMVSGIIWKRLESGWQLKIDATVSYGACLRQFQQTKKFCDVSQVGVAREIKIDGPYNSYLRYGLPAGPISNPGMASLNAALNPTQSPYWYYLSTRDTGEIIYSRTAEEHAANRLKHLGL